VILHDFRSALTALSVIPYISDEHAEAATKNSILKLMFSLLKFTIYDDGSFFRAI
jgi:hypothetical protein